MRVPGRWWRKYLWEPCTQLEATIREREKIPVHFHSIPQRNDDDGGFVVFLFIPLQLCVFAAGWVDGWIGKPTEVLGIIVAMCLA